MLDLLLIIVVVGSVWAAKDVDMSMSFVPWIEDESKEADDV